jgi:hypothetical protein
MCNDNDRANLEPKKTTDNQALPLKRAALQNDLYDTAQFCAK